MESLNRGFVKAHPAYIPVIWISDAIFLSKNSFVVIDSMMIVRITSLGIKYLRFCKKMIMADYLHRLHDFFKENQNKTFTVDSLTDTHEKFIDHVKYYIDSRHIINEYLGDYVDVSFNSDYTKIKIHGIETT